MTKKIIRSKILARLKTQKEEDRNRKSGIIKRKLFRTLVFSKAKTVMFYLSFGGEVNTKEMIEQAYTLGKIVAVPGTKGNGAIRPYLLHRDTRLVRGPYGTKEPATKRSISLRNIDLVIVPGVAFDKKGNRLGRGKGCYDVFLNKLPKKTVSLGLAFDFQILPFVPATTEDVPVKRVLFA
ncbi:MAG: 5-formyltetrahydrofolate cyclo-ligase [Candidatus Omnitrophica bacterium]|nr:5-formyltetrahydrofolate cyclo-ligase [Candidatus Omnitrophota bacterium]